MRTKLAKTTTLIIGILLMTVFTTNDSFSQTGCTWTGTTAPATVWNGSQDNNWQNANNWTSGVPNSTANAYIPSGCPRNPILYGDGPTYPAANCYTLNIYSTGGATLTWNTSTALLNVFKP